MKKEKVWCPGTKSIDKKDRNWRYEGERGDLARPSSKYCRCPICNRRLKVTPNVDRCDNEVVSYRIPKHKTTKTTLNSPSKYRKSL